MKFTLFFLLSVLIISCGDPVNQRETNPFIDAPIDAPAAPSKTESRIRIRAFYIIATDQDEELPKVKQRQIHNLLSKSRKFYRDQMVEHGHGRKTFELLKNGRFTSIEKVQLKYSQHSYLSGNKRPITELHELLELPEYQQFINVFFLAFDLPNVCGLGGSHYVNTGLVFVDTSCWTWQTVSHELGHAFGLHHDFRKGKHSSFIMAYGSNRNKLSSGAAQWLDNHPAFNQSPYFDTGPHFHIMHGYHTTILRTNPLKLEFSVYDHHRLPNILNYNIVQFLDASNTFPELISFQTPLRAKRSQRDPNEIIYRISLNQKMKTVPERITIKMIVNNAPLIKIQHLNLSN